MSGVTRALRRGCSALQGGQADTARTFIAEKLAEGAKARHKRMGDSRYVVEPNVKRARAACATCTRSSGSGNTSVSRAGRAGRGRAAHQAGIPPVPPGENFLWAVRCHSPDHGSRRRPADLRRPARDCRADALCRPAGHVEVERFMRFYFAGEGGRRPDCHSSPTWTKFAARGGRFGFLRRPGGAGKLKNFTLDRIGWRCRGGSSKATSCGRAQGIGSPACIIWASHPLAVAGSARRAWRTGAGGPPTRPVPRALTCGPETVAAG